MTNKRVVIVVLSFIAGIIMALAALMSLHGNARYGGFGHGIIYVDHCQDRDWAQRVYQCTGRYRAGDGDTSVKDVSGRVIGSEYHEGDIIPDIYPISLIDIHDSKAFITGTERRSVVHNIPWLVFLAVGVLLPAFTLTVVLVSRHAHKKHA